MSLHRAFRRPLAALTAALMLLSAGLSACSRSEDATPAVAHDNAVELNVDAPKVTVIDTGDPTTATALRWRRSDRPDSDDSATKESLTVRNSSGFNQTVADASSLDTTAPAGGDVTTLSLPMTVGAGEEENTLDLTLGTPESSDLSHNSVLATAQGFHIGITRTDRGVVSTLRLAAPQQASDDARVLVEEAVLNWLSLQVVFPEDPVGAGARWTVESRVPGENSMLQTVTYTLEKLNGDQAELSAEITRRSTLGSLRSPEDNLQLDIVSTDSTSQGHITADLSSALTCQGTLAVTTRLVYARTSPAHDAAEGSESDAGSVAVIQDHTNAIEYSS